MNSLSKRLNILMLSPIQLFPTNVGDRVRIKEIALGLSNYHQVTLIAPSLNGTKWIENTNLQYRPVVFQNPTLLKKISSLFSKWPFHTNLRYSREIEQEIKKIIANQNFNLIYCHFIQTLPYLEKLNIPIILDQHNVDYIYWERQIQQYKNPILKWLAKENLKKTTQFEKSNLAKLNGYISVSKSDRMATQKYAEKIVPYFFVAPNGVNIKQFTFKKNISIKKKLILGFFGSMDLRYNEDGAIELIQQIAPNVQKQLPNISCEILILGRNPSELLKKIAIKSKLQVIITGTVEDPLPYLHQMNLLILPLNSGAGTKLRIVEAMAAGIPVIGSPLAITGFEDYTNSKHLFVANSSSDFENIISSLVQNLKLFNDVRCRARVLVEEKFSWHKITTQLAQDLLQLQ